MSFTAHIIAGSQFAASSHFFYIISFRQVLYSGFIWRFTAINFTAINSELGISVLLNSIQCFEYSTGSDMITIVGWNLNRFLNIQRNLKPTNKQMNEQTKERKQGGGSWPLSWEEALRRCKESPRCRRRSGRQSGRRAGARDAAGGHRRHRGPAATAGSADSKAPSSFTNQHLTIRRFNIQSLSFHLTIFASESVGNGA